jgi:exodeoxyribonuclease VII large subunit
MLNTLRRRFPLAEVVLAPTPVQGDDAPPAIARALEQVNALAHPDVILLARGGGSLEDLWAFNDERVAYAVAASTAPVITGIGHETDFTIADFVADLRAPTPTAAAELATPDKQDLRSDLAERLAGLGRGLGNVLFVHRWRLDGVRSHMRSLSPLGSIRQKRLRLDEANRRAFQALDYHLNLQRTLLSGIRLHLGALSPFAVLNRGYAIVTKADGDALVKCVSDVYSAPG